MKRVAFYCVNDIKEGSRTPLGSGREGKCPVDSYQPRVVRHLCRATGTQAERSGPLLPSSQILCMKSFMVSDIILYVDFG